MTKPVFPPMPTVLSMTQGALVAKASKIFDNATALRDECYAIMSEASKDPDLVADRFDPGDCEVMIKGNGHNVLRVLFILDALGVPGCRPR